VTAVLTYLDDANGATTPLGDWNNEPITRQ